MESEESVVHASVYLSGSAENTLFQASQQQ